MNQLLSTLYAVDAGSPYSHRSWWDRSGDGSSTSQAGLQASDEMIYQCDTTLGSPFNVDCSQLESSQISPSSDTLNVGPSMMFLHQNSCYIAIGASEALVITWEQVRIALNTLLGVCINHPYNPSQGGRAFYSTPLVHSRSGQTKRGSQTALNALPPHVNITVFQQKEAWTNAVNEIDTCTWKAVVNGSSVTACTNT